MEHSSYLSHKPLFHNSYHTLISILPMGIFTPCYTHGSSSPKLYLNHGYSPHHSAAHHSHLQQHHYRELLTSPHPFTQQHTLNTSTHMGSCYPEATYHFHCPETIYHTPSTTISHKDPHHYRVRRDFAKHLQVFHPCFKKRSKKTSHKPIRSKAEPHPIPVPVPTQEGLYHVPVHFAGNNVSQSFSESEYKSLVQDICKEYCESDSEDKDLVEDLCKQAKLDEGDLACATAKDLRTKRVYSFLSSAGVCSDLNRSALSLSRDFVAAINRALFLLHEKKMKFEWDVDSISFQLKDGFSEKVEVLYKSGDVCGVLVQYPGTEGIVLDYSEFIKKIHGLLFKLGLELDVFVGSALVDTYLKFGLVADAHEVFVELPVRDVVLKRCWLARYCNLCLQHGIHVEIAETKCKYWSTFAGNPVDVVLAAGEKAKEEMFMREIVLDGFLTGPVKFSCESWVHSKFDNPTKRVFFSNKPYLPSEKPEGLKKLRAEELISLRGNGQGEHQSFDRIYDYNVYNDLGDPDTNPDHKRPLLGGNEHPYPRRCRTGRPRCNTDPLSEKRSDNVYVPRDECFSDVKQLMFSANTLKSAFHALLLGLRTTVVDKNLGFLLFSSIDDLFNKGYTLPPQKEKGFLMAVLPRLVRLVNDATSNILCFETPATMDKDRFFWFRDEEFGRQTIAGLNPCCIQLVTEWPLKRKLDPDIYGPAESAITTEIIEQQIRGFFTVEKAIKQKKLFILDYYDFFMPLVEEVRKLEGTTLYGSRTLFFLTHDGALRPLATELARPPMNGKPQWRQVYTPSWHSTEVWLWRLAKAHVLAHDAAKAGLVSGKDNIIDRSIQDAYINFIHRAKNFIYIGNQYFLGSCYAWNADGIKPEDSGALHLIPKELSLKIVSKIEAGEKFTVYVVVPMLPEGVPENASVQAILDWLRRTLDMKMPTNSTFKQWDPGKISLFSY